MSIQSTQVAESLTSTFRAAKMPLTNDQIMILNGSLAVWIEKIREEAFKQGVNSLAGALKGSVRLSDAP